MHDAIVATPVNACSKVGMVSRTMSLDTLQSPINLLVSWACVDSELLVFELDCVANLRCIRTLESTCGCNER